MGFINKVNLLRFSYMKAGFFIHHSSFAALAFWMQVLYQNVGDYRKKPFIYFKFSFNFKYFMILYV